MCNESENMHILHITTHAHQTQKRIMMLEKNQMRAILYQWKNNGKFATEMSVEFICGWWLYDFIWYNYTKYENWNRLQLARTSAQWIAKISYLIIYYSVKLSTVVAFFSLSHSFFLSTHICAQYIITPV